MQNKSGMYEKEVERIIQLTESGHGTCMAHEFGSFSRTLQVCPPLLAPMKERRKLVMEQFYPAVSRLPLVDVAVSLPPLQHR